MCVSVYEEELRKFDSYLTLLRLKYIALYRTFYGCSVVVRLGVKPPEASLSGGSVPGYYSPRGPPLRGGGGWGNRKRNHIDSVSALLTFFHDRSISCIKSRVPWRPSCPRLWAARARADDRRSAGDCLVVDCLRLLRVLVRVRCSNL